MKKIIYSLLSLMLLVPMALTSSRAVAESPNLIANASVETATNNQPASWSTNSWGTNTPTFSYSSDAHTGSKSLSVSVTNYSNGDAKWKADQVPVTSGQTYTYSDYSKSNVVTELDAAYFDAAGKASFVYLQSIPASSVWQQSTSSITIPTGVVSLSVYHIVYSNGTLQTDDFSLTAPDQTTPPPSPTPTPTPTPTPDPSGNLITNGSFETANGTDPAGWNRGGWGTNTRTLTYTSGTARTGSRSANVSMTSATNGDVKWYANPTTVTPGTTYTYQDYYTSNVSTRVMLVSTDTSGVSTYTELSPAAAASAWTLYSASFSAAENAKTVTIYHLLDKVGSLSIDDVSLIAGNVTPPPTPPPTPSPTSNLVPNSSFETASGTKPADWSSDKWGTNTAAFSYVQNDAHSGTSSAKVTVTNYSSGDAKWSFTPITTLTPGGQYTLSAWYKTNTQPHMVAAYVNAKGVTQYLTLPNPLPASNAATTWQKYSATLDVPSDAVSMTVYFLVSSNGWLQTDDYSLVAVTPTGFSSPLISLTFDDGWSSIYTNGLPLLQKYGLVSTQYLISGTLNTSGYMTTAMAKAFQTSGSEIASHTVTHPDLTKLTSAQLTAELSNSQTKLRQLFGTTGVAQDFATPYGTYNSTVIAQIKQYYQSHRSTDAGFNSKDNFDPYNILVQDVNTDTTPAQVAAWVAKAKTNKTWLVLVYHGIVNSPNPIDYESSPANLDTELSNIKASGMPVQTVAQALATIKSQP
jgi:peptidoglycan/xylan/chitin deacetylase (PgdA/CDA1 family)